MSLKILISANSLWNIYNFRLDLIDLLIGNNYKIIIAAPYEKKYFKKLSDLGCIYRHVPIDSKSLSPIKDFFLFLKYVKIINEIKPNIYLGFTIKPNIYGSIAAKIFKIPRINNISGLGTVFLKGGFLQFFVEFFYKISLQKSNLVFFQNNEDSKKFIKKRIVNPNNIQVLPGSGVNLNKFKYSKPIKRNFDETKFLFLGRFLYDKGILELIQAARIIKKKHPNIIFSFLGFIENNNKSSISIIEFNKWIQEGLISYLGHKDDVEEFIKDSDCVILPSYREGTPRSLLEAASIGRPIITTDVPGCRDVVDDEINGFLCKSKNYKSLLKSIGRFLDLSYEKRIQFGKAGRLKMENNYNQEIVLDKYKKEIDYIILN